jgi:hypothetical protein
MKKRFIGTFDSYMSPVSRTLSRKLTYSSCHLSTWGLLHEGLSQGNGVYRFLFVLGRCSERTRHPRWPGGSFGSHAGNASGSQGVPSLDGLPRLRAGGNTPAER